MWFPYRPPRIAPQRDPVRPREVIHERQADSKAAATRYAALQWLATAASQTIRESRVNQIIVIGASAGSVKT